jgi:hypothetical protein
VVTQPKLGELVTEPCIRCKREPREGEMFGPHAEGWDFIGLCPKCWDEITYDPEED